MPENDNLVENRLGNTPKDSAVPGDPMEAHEPLTDTAYPCQFAEETKDSDESLTPEQTLAKQSKALQLALCDLLDRVEHELFGFSVFVGTAEPVIAHLQHLLILLPDDKGIVPPDPKQTAKDVRDRLKALAVALAMWKESMELFVSATGQSDQSIRALSEDYQKKVQDAVFHCIKNDQEKLAIDFYVLTWMTQMVQKLLVPHMNRREMGRKELLYALIGVASLFASLPLQLLGFIWPGADYLQTLSQKDLATNALLVASLLLSTTSIFMTSLYLSGLRPSWEATNSTLTSMITWTPPVCLAIGVAAFIPAVFMMYAEANIIFYTAIFVMVIPGALTVVQVGRGSVYLVQQLRKEAKIRAPLPKRASTLEMEAQALPSEDAGVRRRARAS